MQKDPICIASFLHKKTIKIVSKHVLSFKHFFRKKEKKRDRKREREREGKRKRERGEKERERKRGRERDKKSVKY